MKRAGPVSLFIINLFLSFVVYTSEYFEISAALSHLEQLTITHPSVFEQSSLPLNVNHTHAQRYQNTLMNNEGDSLLGDVKNIKNWPISQTAELFTRPMYRAHEKSILKNLNKLFLDYAHKFEVESDVDIVSFFIAYACILNAAYISTSLTSLTTIDINLTNAINAINDLLSSIKYSLSMRILPVTVCVFDPDEEREYSDNDTDNTSDEEDNDWPSCLPLFHELEKKKFDVIVTTLQRVSKFKNIKIGDLFDEYHLGKIVVLSLVADTLVMDNFLTPFYEKSHRKMNTSSLRIQAQSIVRMLKSSAWLKENDTKNPYLDSLKFLLDSLIDADENKS